MNVYMGATDDVFGGEDFFPKGALDLEWRLGLDCTSLYISYLVAEYVWMQLLTVRRLKCRNSDISAATVTNPSVHPDWESNHGSPAYWADVLTITPPRPSDVVRQF